MFAISYFYLKKQTKPKQRTIIQPNPFTRHPPFLCFSHTVTSVKGVDHIFIITSSLVIPVQLLQYDFCPIVPQRLVLSRSSMVLMVQNLVNTSWTSSWPFSSIWHSEAPPAILHLMSMTPQIPRFPPNPLGAPLTSTPSLPDLWMSMFFRNSSWAPFLLSLSISSNYWS